MTDRRKKIKDAIERQVGNGDWNGVEVNGNRAEGSLGTLDIDPDSIEVEEVDLVDGTMIVTASGLGSSTYNDGDSEEDQTEELDVKVKARVSIDIGDASIIDVSIED